MHYLVCGHNTILIKEQNNNNMTLHFYYKWEFLTFLVLTQFLLFNSATYAFSLSKGLASLSYHRHSSTITNSKSRQSHDSTSGRIQLQQQRWYNSDSIHHLSSFRSTQSSVLLLSSRSNNKYWLDDEEDDDGMNNDLFKEELEKLKLNLSDEMKELTYTIEELQKQSKKKKKKMESTVTMQNILVCVNVALFIYQIVTAPRAVRPTNASNSSTIRRWYTGLTKKRGYHKNKVGTATLLPNVLFSTVTTDFMFMSILANQGRQPHRYLTSGFLHGGILHLLLNMRSLYKTPTWLEAGLGKPLYITVYLLSTVGANLCHAAFYGSRTPTIGSSGAICGLMGYEFIMWRKMKRTMNSNHIIQNMFAMLLVGALVPCVSNASHIGGFAAGALVGWILGPAFTKSYAAKRNRLNYSSSIEPPPALQRVMGFDLAINPPMVSLKLFWTAILLLCATNANTRRIPELILRGIFYPGSLSKGLIKMV